ncbi:MAG: hypothetical protein ABII12_08540 [Planctomycetota bacterium]
MVARIQAGCPTPLVHPVLASEQEWADLDRRGNWLDLRWAKGGESYHEERTRNGVNEYETLDPDGADGLGTVSTGGGGGHPPVALTHGLAAVLLLSNPAIHP